MKKIFSVAASFLFFVHAQAQEPSDALRTGWNVAGGTARAQAIGGAMGSLGGDITATFVNPAGIGFYRTGDLVFTPRLQFGKTKATYFGNTESQQQNRFNIGTSGVVFGGGTATGNIRSASLALAYNRTADFNSNILYQGATNKSSYSQRYLEEIEGQNANDVAEGYEFGASLALNTYYIDTISGPSGGVAGFQSRVPVATGLLQRQRLEQRGGIDEFAIAGGFNVKDKVLLGVTLGIPYLHYNRTGTFSEADATEDATNGFDAMVLQEDLETQGRGFNLKLGVIFKPQEAWRIGLAFHTPTIYSLTDNYYVSMNTNTEAYQGELNQNSEAITGGPSEFKYSMTTPYRAIASLSYVLRETADVTKQKGFLTVDAEYVAHKSSSFYTNDDFVYDQTDKDYFDALNDAIDAAYKGAFNFRAGGELKFTTFMVRAGAAYYGNPYKNINGEKGSRINLSGGLGYRDKGFFADLTYVYAMNRDTHFAYRLQNPAQYEGAAIKQNLGNVVFTVGVKL